LVYRFVNEKLPEAWHGPDHFLTLCCIAVLVGDMFNDPANFFLRDIGLKSSTWLFA
jgi:hypothetical protein